MEEFNDNAPSKGTLLRGAIAFILILFVGFMVLRVASSMRKRPKKKNTTRALSLKVTTKTASYQKSLLYLKGFGTARSYKTVDLVPEVSGKIVYTIKPFKEGTFVKRRQTLFRIERSNYSLEYERLKAQLASLKKQIVIAKRAYKVSRTNLARNRRLVRRRALDRGTYERLEQTVLDRGQRLESLLQSQQVTDIQLRRAALNLRRTSVRAPFAARITRGTLTRGSFVSQGRSVGTIESIDAIEIPVAFPVDALRKITYKDGRPAKLGDIPKVLKSLPPVEVEAEGIKWKGNVERTGATVDLSTRTVTLYVKVDLAKQNQIGNLLPGTFCQVRIPARHMDRSFTIPKRALYTDHVYVVVNGKLTRRQVSTSYTDEQTVYIAGGLQDGDKVIITPLEDPIEGTPVYAEEGGSK